MTLSPQQQQMAQVIETIAGQHGIPPERAKELAAAAYAESGLDAGNWHGKAEGQPFEPGKTAGGLFELLSPGYVQKAAQTGGVLDPRANTEAIVGDYANYWKTHPNAAPGDAGRDVERSGEGSGFYAKGLPLLGAAPASAPAPAAPMVAPQVAAPQSRSQLAAGLIENVRQGEGPAGMLKTLLGPRPAQQARTVPGATGQLHVEVTHNQPVAPGASTVVNLAEQYLGTPYKWGGAAPGGFDCSGFVQWLYAKQGIRLPRTTYGQIDVGQHVDAANLRPGDIVFFSNKGDVHHEGLYIGAGQFIHSPHTGDVVKISSLSEPYYQQQFAGGRRVA